MPKIIGVFLMSTASCDEVADKGNTQWQRNYDIITNNKCGKR